MSTLAEIEQAVEALPRKQRESLLARLGSEPSCYDLSRDLFEEPGRLGASGKRDLSTNEAHLAGLGRKRSARGWPRCSPISVRSSRCWTGRKCIGCSLVLGPAVESVLQGPYGEDTETILFADTEEESR